MRRVILVWLSGFLLAAEAQSTTIRVPADQPTLQAGMDAAASGDTVLVAPGTYSGPGNRNLSLSGRELVLRSEAGATQTVIDAAFGGQPGRVIELIVVGPATAIEGFTLQNGDARTLSLGGRGGGALLLACAPTFRDCIFRQNRAESGLGAGGGAVACVNSAARFEHCSFFDNFVQGSIALGGAVVCVATSAPTFRQCLFQGNSVSTPSGLPNSTGGAVIVDNSSPLFEDCSFIANTADGEAGAIWSGAFSQLTMRRCVFSANIAWNGGAGKLEGMANLEDCDFISNQGRFGGAIELGAQNPIVTRGRFLDNTAEVEGGGVRCANSEVAELRECVIAGNTAPAGGAMFLYHAIVAVTQCTFHGNSSGVQMGRPGDPIPSQITISRSILSASTDGPAIECGTGIVTLTCTDVFGNVGGDWVGCIAGQNGTGGNFSLDPIFCGPDEDDFALQAKSPCTAENSPAGCGLIGALDAACGVTAIGDAEPSSARPRLIVTPNPVRGAARFQCNAGVSTRLVIYDTQGRQVAELPMRNGGWDWAPGASIPAGVYFALPNAPPAGIETVKFLVVR